jgi:hypothetical protein
MTEKANKTHSFILRVWRSGIGQEWKGWVQHADSGESLPLASMDDLQAFIEQYINQGDLPISLQRSRTKKKSGLR